MIKAYFIVHATCTSLVTNSIQFLNLLFNHFYFFLLEFFASFPIGLFIFLRKQCFLQIKYIVIITSYLIDLHFATFMLIFDSTEIKIFFWSVLFNFAICALTLILLLPTCSLKKCDVPRKVLDIRCWVGIDKIESNLFLMSRFSYN